MRQRIPGAGITIGFTHTLESVGEGRTRITHHVTISGPAADYLGPAIGPEMAEGIPDTMYALMRMAQLREVEARECRIKRRASCLIGPSDFPSKFKRPEDSPGSLLWQVTNSWQRRIRHALKEIGLTHVQFVLLTTTEWLNNAELSTTQTNVARFAHTDVMMTSQVIRTLEGKGLVIVETDRGGYEGAPVGGDPGGTSVGQEGA